MELIDNINNLLGDDFKETLKPGARLKIAASCLSMYAFEALKAELEKIDELQFIFTSPAFTANEVTDKIRKERKQFHSPKVDRERSFYGTTCFGTDVGFQVLLRIEGRHVASMVNAPIPRQSIQYVEKHWKTNNCEGRQHAQTTQ